MRTSRPMKGPPRPLLDHHKDTGSGSKRDRKGKGKARQQESEPATSAGDVYSYSASAKKGKGARRAEQRIKGAREDVSQSFAAGPSGSGKKRPRQDEDADEDEDDEEDGSLYAADDIAKYKDVKFKLGLDSDNEDGVGGRVDDEDDEEIDSDMAGSESDEAPSIKAPKKRSQAKPKRQVATDFYGDSEEDEDAGSIDLNEDDDDDDEDGDGFIDLSEVLEKQIQKDKAAEAKAKGKTAALPGIKESLQEPLEDLTAFKPGSLSKHAESSEGDEGSESESGEEDGSEEEISSDEEGDEDDDDAALDRLGDIVSKLSSDKGASNSAKAQASADDKEAQKRRRKQLLDSERTEAMPEGEFYAGGNTGKLTLDSLISSLGTEQANALKQSLKPLIASEKHKSATVNDTTSAIEAELNRLTADERALLAREKRSDNSNPLRAPGALPAPLAPLHQAKIERQAAREKQEEKIKEWDQTVRYMKGVNRDGEDDPETRLDLKALNDSQGKGKGVTSAELVAKFAPSNDMEKQINALIAATGATQSDLLATESSALMDALPTKSTEAADAQDRARVAQLRLARELMFRAERKAKRVAKIKSRTYRKIAKKGRQRQALKDGDGSLTIEEMAELDALDGGERAEVERERLETLRARERATLRHASGTSGATAGGRWSRSIKGHEGMDDDMKQALRDRESKQDLLRRKILGQESDRGSDDSSGSDDGDNDDMDEEDENQLKTRALDEMERIQTSDSNPSMSKGVMGMKFMQRAAKRDQERVDGMIEDFRMQVEGEDGDAEERAVNGKTAARGGELIQENPGRMIFGPSAASVRNGQAPEQTVPDGGLSQRAKKRLKMSKTGGTISINGSASTPISPAPHSAASSATLLDYNPFASLTTGKDTASPSTSTSAKVNPWLTQDADNRVRTTSRKVNEGMSKDSSDADKAASRVQKTQSRTKEAIKRAQADAAVEIDVDQILSNPSLPDHLPDIKTASSPAPPTSPGEESRRQNRENAPPPSSSVPKQKERINGQSANDSESDSESDADELPEAVRRNQGANAFKQRDLVARAFAGDNVVTDFVEMKRAEIEADAPQEEDMTLPGWGAWGGKAVRKSQKQQQKRKVKHIPGIEASQRRDAKFGHVILSEKTDKKASKYQAKDLPYPYTSAKQFEQKLAQPTGIEWNTRGTVKEMTTPRILTKPGMVIKPVSRKM